MKIFASLVNNGESSRIQVATVNTIEDAENLIQKVKNRGGVWVSKIGRRTTNLSLDFITTEDDEFAVVIVIDVSEVS